MHDITWLTSIKLTWLNNTSLFINENIAQENKVQMVCTIVIASKSDVICLYVVRL